MGPALGLQAAVGIDEKAQAKGQTGVRRLMFDVAGFGTMTLEGRASASIADSQLAMFPTPWKIDSVEMPPELGFNLVTIKQFMAVLQFALWEEMYADCSGETLKKLHVDLKKSTIHARIREDWEDCPEVEGYFHRLPLAGTVSLTPTPHSFPLCVAQLLQYPRQSQIEKLHACLNS